MSKLVFVLALSVISSTAFAYDPSQVDVTGHELPAELNGVGVDEHLGQNIDLDLVFTNDKGEDLPLRTYFRSGRPVLMAMVYYNCPSLCNYLLNGLTETMKTLKWTVGQEFEVVAVSMDHRETSDLAGKKKRNYVAAYGRVASENGWHFLVGSEDNVKRLADQLGFRFKWLEDKKQFAHAAVSYVITGDGRISRYLHGVQPEANTLKLSLLEASGGQIGTLVDRALMFCFQFDPQKNKYTLYAWNIMRIGALFMVVMLAILLVPVWWREQGD